MLIRCDLSTSGLIRCFFGRKSVFFSFLVNQSKNSIRDWFTSLIKSLLMMDLSDKVSDHDHLSLLVFIRCLVHDRSKVVYELD